MSHGAVGSAAREPPERDHGGQAAPLLAQGVQRRREPLLVRARVKVRVRVRVRARVKVRVVCCRPCPPLPVMYLEYQLTRVLIT